MFEELSEPKFSDWSLLTSLTDASGEIYIISRSDNMQISLAISLGCNQRTPASSTIKRLLSSKDIKCPINDEAIIRAINSLCDQSPCTDFVLIGEGTPALDGKDGYLKPLFDPTQPRVSAGDPLFKVMPPTQGSKGVDIFGQEVAPKAGESIKPEIGQHVIKDKETEQYQAEVDGFAMILRHKVLVSKYFNIQINADASQANLSFRKDETCDEDLFKLLKELDISYGLKEDSIRRSLDVDEINNLIIAEGTPVEEGQDAAVLYNFARKKTWRTIGKQYAKIQQQPILQMYDPSHVVLKIKAAVKGTDGVNVFGEKILAKTVKDINVMAGENVHTEQKQGIQFFSGKMRGTPIFNKNRLDIIDEFIVDGDLHPDIGNIDFEGNILIKGDVQNGFILKSKKDITVKGVVYKSSLFADGNIVVTAGISGIGPGNFNCKGCLETTYIDECYIELDGDLIVTNEIIASHIFCRGAVICEKAEIHGGDLIALRGINVKAIGSEHQVRTHVTAGMDYIYESHLKAAQTQIKKLDLEEVKLNHDLYEFKLKPEIIKLATPKQKQDFKDKLQRLAAIAKEKRELLEPLEAMKAEVDKVAHPEIQVHKIIQPGTTIEIGENSYHTRLAIKGPVRVIDDKKIRFVEN